MKTCINCGKEKELDKYYFIKNTPTENYIRQSKIIKHLKKNHNLSYENNVQGLKIKDWKIKSHNQEIIKL